MMQNSLTLNCCALKIMCSNAKSIIKSVNFNHYFHNNKDNNN